MADPFPVGVIQPAVLEAWSPEKEPEPVSAATTGPVDDETMSAGVLVSKSQPARTTAWADPARTEPRAANRVILDFIC